MFPISSEGVLEDPSIFFEQENFLEDLLADCPILEGNDITTDQNIAKKRPRKKASSSNEVQENVDDCKKTAHRFTERQRRQEMSALYASLRSLLPLEYVKGKRAISDHMHEAVNYINDMKKKMGQMQKRRDELKKLCNLASTSSAEDSKTNVDDSTSFVKINVLRDGMEILISSSINKERFPLSKVFQDLFERNLNIINCVSSTVDSCFLHKIHVEINDATSIDLLELQGQLENLIRGAFFKLSATIYAILFLYILEIPLSGSDRWRSESQNGKFETEASVNKIGQSGVTYISSGSLTHSVKALDISLKIDTKLALEVGKHTKRA